MASQNMWMVGLIFSATVHGEMKPPAVVERFSALMEAEGFDAVIDPAHNEAGESVWTPDRWNRSSDFGGSSAKLAIIGNGGQTVPATCSVEVPADGEYFLWICQKLNPDYITSISVEVLQDRREIDTLLFAEYRPAADRTDPQYHFKGNDWWAWSMKPVSLKKGPVELRMKPDNSSNTFVIVDAVLLVGDPAFVPDFRNVADGGVLDN